MDIPSRKLRVLILSGDSETVLRITKLLEESPFNMKIRIVNEWQAYAKEVQISKPELVIADYELEDLNGVEALRIAKRKTRRCSFMFLVNAVNSLLITESVLGAQGVSACVLKSELNSIVKVADKVLSRDNPDWIFMKSHMLIRKSREIIKRNSSLKSRTMNSLIANY